MFPARIYIGQIVVVFGIVVTSTWGATQWAAHALGYQEGLGPPWFTLASYPVYLPWRLFEWWFAYEAYAPGIFERAGAMSAGGGIGGALFEAGQVSTAAQLRASLSALPFALAKRDLPVSPLIGVAFPPVYFELLRSTGDEDFKRLPSLLLLPISIFYDWDKAKSARHEIVDAYLSSSWPPADLLMTSIAAGIQRETIHRLEGTHRGRDYLGAIDNNSHRLTPAQFSKVQDCLSRHWRRH